MDRRKFVETFKVFGVFFFSLFFFLGGFGQFFFLNSFFSFGGLGSFFWGVWGGFGHFFLV